MLKNEKGSVLTVAVVMIALLSFSLTSITAYTFRTAANTNRIVEDNESQNEAKRLVQEGIVRFEDEIMALVNTESGMDTFANFETNYEDDPIIEAIEADLGVTITEAENLFDAPIVETDVVARSYRVAYAVSDDRELVRYIHFTNKGIEYEEFNAFTYSLGSSTNVVLNGGEYLESADIYGGYLYEGYSTAYKDTSGNYQIVDAGVFNYPAGDDATFTSPNPYKCNTDRANDPALDLCLSVNSENKLVVHSDLYETVETPESEYFGDLFSGFNFTRMYYNQLEEHVEATALINDDTYYTYFTDAISNGEMEELTTNITGTSNFTLNADSVIDGNATVNIGANTLDLNGHSLIVLGDFDITSVSRIESPGQIYVFGDVTISNDRNIAMTANLYTTGEINVGFDEGHGFEITANGQANEGFGFFARGNIVIDNNTTTALNNGARMSLFIFSEGSVKIDSSLHEMAFGGALYAQGITPLDDVLIERNGVQEPFNGLLINSYNGTIDPSGDTDPTPGDTNDSPGNSGGNGKGKPGTSPGGGGPPSHAGGGKESNTHLFSFNALDESTPGNSPSQNLEASFSDLPDFERLVIVPIEGDLSIEYSTFSYEEKAPPE